MRELSFSTSISDHFAHVSISLRIAWDIRAKVEDLPTRDEFNELQQDVKNIKAAVTDLSHDLEKHKSLPAHVAHGHA